MRRRRIWRYVLVSGMAALPLTGVAGTSVGGASPHVAQARAASYTVSADWKPSHLPVPADAKTTRRSVYIHGISCPTTTWCITVGDYKSQTMGNRPFVDVLSGGTWRSHSLDMPADTKHLYLGGAASIACTAPNECLLTGEYTDPAGLDNVLAYQLKDGQWSEVPGGTPSDRFDDPTFSSLSLDSTACISASDCVAVGGYEAGDENNFDSYGLIDTLRDGSWSSAHAPPADGTSDTSLSAVTCLSSPDYCVAVGSILETPSHPVADIYQDGSWSAYSLPIPPDAALTEDQWSDARLTGIHCFAVSHCISVGSYMTTTRVLRGLVAQFNDGQWTVSALPLPADATKDFEDGYTLDLRVACPLADKCFAVGNYEQGKYGNTYPPLMDTLSGNTWTTQRAPLPKDHGTSAGYLAGIACPTSKVCFAAGTYDRKQKYKTAPFLDTWKPQS